MSHPAYEPPERPHASWDRFWAVSSLAPAFAAGVVAMTLLVVLSSDETAREVEGSALLLIIPLLVLLTLAVAGAISNANPKRYAAYINHLESQNQLLREILEQQARNTTPSDSD